MSALFTVHRRASRCLAVLVIAAGWLVPLAVPHAAVDDPVCVPGMSADEAASRVGASSASQVPDHCAVCHAARSFRSAFASPGALAVLTAIAIVQPPAYSPRRPRSIDRLPARAPPAPTASA